MKITLPKIYNQLDPKWKNEKHGTSTSTLGATGCTISLLAMILCHAGYDETPSTVNKKLTENGGYSSGNLLNWTVVPKLWTRLKFVFRYPTYDNAKALEWIDKGLVPMIAVKASAIGGAPGGKHWVGFLGDGASCDPWGGDIEKTATWEATGMALYEYKPQKTDPTDTLFISSSDFDKLRGNSEKWDKIVTSLEIGTDPATTPFEAVQSAIGGIKSRCTDLQNKLITAEAQAFNEKEKSSRLENQLLFEQNARKDEQINAKKQLDLAQVSVGSCESRVIDLQNQVDEASKAKGATLLELAKVKNDLEVLREKYATVLTNQTTATLNTMLTKVAVNWFTQIIQRIFNK